jgi:crotonobetainyl-CoA:carnitine CoA-transferase CaiB-like acyl-CoA transferase
VLTALDLLSNPHVVARHGFEFIDAPGVGPNPYPRVAFTLSGTPVPIDRPAPGFAEDNDRVFGGLLGLAAADIAKLEAAAVTSRVPLAGH